MRLGRNPFNGEVPLPSKIMLADGPEAVGSEDNIMGEAGRWLAYVGTPYTDRDTTYTLANQRTEAYDALDVSARQTFARQYGWMAGYTRSSARSNATATTSRTRRRATPRTRAC